MRIGQPVSPPLCHQFDTETANVRKLHSEYGASKEADQSARDVLGSPMAHTTGFNASQGWFRWPGSEPICRSREHAKTAEEPPVARKPDNSVIELANRLSIDVGPRDFRDRATDN